jgi:hypothetical protein
MRTRALLLIAALVGVLAATSCSGGEAAAPPAPSETPTTTGAGATAPPGSGTTTPVSAATTTSLPPPLPAPSPPIASPGSNKLFVLGDSVILGAKNQIPKELLGWDVTFDAKESRFINNSLDVLKAHKLDFDRLRGLARSELEQAYKDAGKPPPKQDPAPSIIDVIGRVIVINLCTNYQAGGGFASYIDAFMGYLKGADRVVWVTCAEWSPGQVESNQAIKDAATRYPNIVVADWAAFSPTPGYTYDDHIHLKEPGQIELARLISVAVGAAPTPLPPAPTTTKPKPTTTTTTTTTPTTTSPPAPSEP